MQDASNLRYHIKKKIPREKTIHYSVSPSPYITPSRGVFFTVCIQVHQQFMIIIETVSLSGAECNFTLGTPVLSQYFPTRPRFNFVHLTKYTTLLSVWGSVNCLMVCRVNTILFGLKRTSHQFAVFLPEAANLHCQLRVEINRFLIWQYITIEAFRDFILAILIEMVWCEQGLFVWKETIQTVIPFH